MRIIDRDDRGDRDRALAVTKGGRGVSADTVAMIDAFVEKYLAMLGAQHLPRPRLEFRSNIVKKWLGADLWRPSDPSNTTLLLQKSILGDPRTLERVVAHEVIHHTDFMAMTLADVAMVRLGIRREGHGASFLEKAARINAEMGEGFVTVKSDAEYVQARNVKPFFMLIAPLSEFSPSAEGGSMAYTGKFGWAWAMRLSHDGQMRAAKMLALGARLVSSTDERWLVGAKIKKRGGFSVPRVPDEAELRRLFLEEPEVGVAASLRSWAEATMVAAQAQTQS